MDQEDIKTLYDDKYKKLLGLSYEEWSEAGPQSEAEAYARMQEIDEELKTGYDEWYEAEGDAKAEMEDYRDKLKAEYDFIESAFGLEAPDKNW
jgi:molecular chaperone GrpE (heat shock protein)